MIIDYQFSECGDFQEGLARVKLDAVNALADSTGKIITGDAFYSNIDYRYSNGLVKVRTGGRYGYVDLNGDLIIKAVFENCRSFSEGLAAVNIDGSWGYINTQGRTVITADYDDAGDFKDGLAVVTSGNHSQIIDRHGKTVIPRKQWTLYEPSDGIVKYKLNNKFGYLRIDGTPITECIYESGWNFSDGIAVVSLNDRYFFIDKEGNRITTDTFDRVGRFINGNGSVKINNRWGLIDKNGEIVLEPLYRHAYRMSNGLIRVKLEDYTETLLSAKGERLFNHSFSSLGSISEKLIAVKTNKELWGFINLQGDYVIPAKYRSVQGFQNGVAVVREGYKSGCIDKSGNWVLEPIYDRLRSLNNSVVVAQINGEDTLITLDGKELLNERYDSIELRSTEGIYALSRENKWGYIDPTGHYVVFPSYDSAEDFSSGLARVGKEIFYSAYSSVHYYGFIDKSGKVAIPIVYKDVSSFENNRAIINIGDKRGFLNKENRVQLSGKFELAVDFHEGMGLIKVEDTLGFMDSRGWLLILPKVNSLGGYSEGFAPARVGDKWGYIDKNGNFSISPQFDGEEAFSKRLAKVRIGEKWGLINQSGSFVLEPKYNQLIILNGDIAAYKETNLWGFINLTTNHSVGAQFEDLITSVIRNRLVTKKNGLWGVIGTDFQTLIPHMYEEIKSTPGYDDFCVNVGGKYGYIDSNNNYFIEPVFDKAGIFRDDLAIVSTKGSFGLIERQGRFAVHPQFSNLRYSKDNYICSKNDLHGVIDRYGKIVVNPEYEECRVLSEKLYAVLKNSKWALSEKEDGLLTDFIFDDIGWSALQDRIVFFKDGRYGFLDGTGAVVVENNFEEVLPFYHENFTRVKIDGKYGYIDKAGNYNIRPHYDSLGAISEGVIVAKDKFQLHWYLDTEGEVIGFQSNTVNTELANLLFSNVPPWWQELEMDKDIEISLQIQIGNSDEVICAEYSNDANFILTGSNNDVISLWDATKLIQIRVFPTTGKDLMYCDFTPNDRFCYAIFQDDTVNIWDVQTGDLVKQYIGQDYNIEQVAISDDAKYSLTGTSYWLRLRDLYTGNTLETYENSNEYMGGGGFESQYDPIAFSPDARYFVWGGTDTKYNRLSIYETISGEKLQNYYGHKNNYSEVIFARNGTNFFSGSFDKTIRLWNMYTGKTLKNFEGHQYSAEALVLSPDGKYLLSNEWLWDAETTEKIRSITPRANDVDFAPDSLSFLSANKDNSVSINSIIPNADTRYLRIIREKCLQAFVAGENDRYLIAHYPDSFYVVWDRFKLSHKVIETKSAAKITILYFIPNTNRFLQGQEDGTLLLRDIESGKTIREFSGHDGKVNFLAVEPYSRSFLTGGDDGYLIRWNLSSGKLLAKVKNTFEGYIPLHAKISGNGRFATVVSQDRYTGYYYLHVWDLDTYIHKVFAENGSSRIPENSYRYSSDSHYLVYQPNPKDYSLVDLKSTELSERIIHYDWPISIQSWYGSTYLLISRNGNTKEGLLSDGRVIASKYYSDGWDVTHEREIGQRQAGAPQSQILLVDPKNGRIIKKLAGHDDYIRSVHVSSDGKNVISVGAENRIILWDLENEKAEKIFSGHAGTIHNLLFTSDNKKFLTSSSDSSIRLWDLNTHSYTAFIFDMISDDWLVFTDDGYWDASRNGGSMVAMTRGLESWRIDQFAVFNNRPDKILQKLGSSNFELIKHYSNQHAKRLRKLGLDEAMLSAELHVPTSKIVDQQQDGKFVDLQFQLADTKYNIASYNIYVNDVPLYGAYGRKVSGENFEIIDSIELSSGKNKIEVSCMNQKGAESFRALTFANYDEPVKPDLYFIGFGVSEYMNSNLNLRFADKDTEDLQKIFTSLDGNYQHVITQTYTNKQVTKENIKKVKDILREASVDDTVVLLISGHGVHDRDAYATYYFLTHETDLDNLSGTAINFDELENLFHGIPPRHKLFLMDTCGSGEWEPEMVQKVSGKPGNKGVWARIPEGEKGLAVADDELSDAGPGSPAAAEQQQESARTYLYEKDRYIYNDLMRRSGTIVFSSCRGDEVSYESAEYENGLFTEYMIKALEGEGDMNDDGMVSTEELQQYVMVGVASETEEDPLLYAIPQHPTVDRDNIYVEFGF